MAPVLLSRAVDPLLGIFTGAFAYYLYETHPRTALPPDQRLEPLVRWKLEKWKREKEHKSRAAEGEESIPSLDELTKS